MTAYAYARVSSRDQNLTRQINAFLDFGIDKRRIFCDRKSGKDFDRTQYKKLLKKLKSGDLLVIKSIDRLGRNYDAIIAQWSKIVNEIGADIVVLDMPLLDTREKQDSLVGKFISDIVLQILSFVAENERANIKSRQEEGIRIAKSKGIRFGRPVREYSDEFTSTLDDYMQKRISAKVARSFLGLKRDNFYYHVRRIKKIHSDAR